MNGKDRKVSAIEFINPRVGRYVDVYGGRILRVEGVGTADPVKLIAHLHGQPAGDPSDAVLAYRSGTNFYCGSVPIAGDQPSYGDALILAAWVEEGGNWVLNRQILCYAIPNDVAVVDAQYTVHFAYAGLNTTGEIVGPDTNNRQFGQERERGFRHHPVEILIPQDAGNLMNKLSIEIVGTTTWRNNTDPSYKDNETGSHHKNTVVTYSQYQSANYDSENISQFSAYVCHLIGYWGEDSPPTTAPVHVNQDDPRRLYYDPNASSYAVPTGCDRLFLGFHDGHEWNNNSGQCGVRLNWWYEAPTT